MTERSLDEMLNALVTERVTYFPIRHHSPACAWHLGRMIRSRKPDVVLIEGPASFTSLIPLILHPDAVAPFAVYTSTPAAAADAPDDARRAAALGPRRQAAYYPFCDYSPELVALRVGTEVGATLRFIDLDFTALVAARHGPATDAPAPRTESLQDEEHFRRSQYLAALARKTGCRDHNDLWDHLFETRVLEDASSEQFIRDVAAWCHFARLDSTDAELLADGTHARELAMAHAVQHALADGAHRVIVVTGGFHTVALPSLLTSGTVAPPRTAATDAQNYLIRYGFEQLDTLNGYSAGMPSPSYYNAVWAGLARDPGAVAMTDVAARVLVQLGRLTRARRLSVALSTADEISALEQASRLAALRGHPAPMREDVLDAIRSCFVKGAMDAEGAVVLGVAHHVLGGTSIGSVPAEAGVPPLVADFQRAAKALRLDVTDSVARKSSLDLYRKSSHRRISRFFHALRSLDVPFATFQAGPDFVTGEHLDRLVEHWSYRWTPQTESQLIEAGIHGATVEEAATNRLVQSIIELESSGHLRSAAEAVMLLVRACRMGLQRHTGRLLEWIADQVNADPSLASLTEALVQLSMLWESREPLEAHGLREIPALIQQAYERACYLMHDLPNSSPDGASRNLGAMIPVGELLRSREGREDALDPALFHAPLSAILRGAETPALLVGGAAGLLYVGQRLADADLLGLLAGSLAAATADSGGQVEFLTGLLRAARELAWREPALIAAVDGLLESWSDDDFIARLPHLRLAFASLTPRETDRVAELVSAQHGGHRVDVTYAASVTEQEMLTALRLDAIVARALRDDGLGEWAVGARATRA